ncbi:serine/threonine-protein kinase [Actinomadura sp. 7K534]|uniref:serine/threonine-protein kinase n=1 Tax=Actinomadura sp. 7K534 TaxID=2530366 RepID=UPI001405388F|nr:serine/threonine-protein kinase [Actinomadura sp. 7K534]
MTQEAHLDRIGGRYRLVKELGSGGFGRVWKAHDETLGVDVAVKEVRVPPAASDAERAEFLTRARREARNAARLRDHPGIIPVHDVVIVDDVPWIVMRLVDGLSLEDRLRKAGTISAEEAAKIAEVLLKALDAAHAAGVVHRDIKPANVMLAGSGEALLADFGIAVHQADTALTASGAVIGSMEYLAPERLSGKNNGTAGDLFSLGVTLYRCVEGVSPFRRGTVAETVTALLRDEPPPPTRAGRLAHLITRLLDKDPDTRPTAAEALDLIDGPGPQDPDDKPTARLLSRQRPGPQEHPPSRTTTWIRRLEGAGRRVRRPRVSRGMLVIGICAAVVVAFAGTMVTFASTAYLAKAGDCVHSDGLDIDGWGTWRRHPCALGLPWTENYRVVYRYDERTSCSTFTRTLVLPAKKDKGTATLCIVPDE